jgi:hypothetical protein
VSGGREREGIGLVYAAESWRPANLYANLTAKSSRITNKTRTLGIVLGSVVATSSLPAYWLAADPAHLPHYSHAAAIVGTMIILSMIVLMAGVAFALSKRR